MRYRRKTAHGPGLVLVAMAVTWTTASSVEENPARQRAGGETRDAVTWPRVPVSVSPLQVIEVRSRDGEKAIAVLRKPPGDGPFPAVVFLHGGLRKLPLERLKVSSRAGHTHSRYLAAGYVTVTPTFRDRRQDPQTPKALWDCVAIVQAVKKLPYVDAASVAAYGGSGGGSLALELAGEEKLAAVVAGEPATCLFTGWHKEGPPNSHPEITEDPRRFYTKEVRAFTRKKLKRIRCPVLIVHGDVHPINKINNEVILPEMKELRLPVKSILYPGCRHGFYFGSARRPGDALAVFRDSRAFIERHLGVRPQAIGDDRIELRSIRIKDQREAGGP